MYPPGGPDLCEGPGAWSDSDDQTSCDAVDIVKFVNVPSR